MRHKLALLQAKNARLKAKAKLNKTAQSSLPGEGSVPTAATGAHMSCSENEEFPAAAVKLPQIPDVEMGLLTKVFLPLGSARGGKKKGKPVVITDEILKELIYRPAIAGVQQQLNPLLSAPDKKAGEAKLVRENPENLGVKGKQPPETTLGVRSKGSGDPGQSPSDGPGGAGTPLGKPRGYTG